MWVVTSAQIAALDRKATEQFGIPSALLMERAGRWVAHVTVSLASAHSGRRVVVLCGKGNNGGDGLVAARYLGQSGMHVEVLLAAGDDSYTGDARNALDAARQAGIPIHTLNAGDIPRAERLIKSADVVVDALFGTGFRGPARGIAADLIDLANRADRPIVAVDIPSGLEADTGRPSGPCIRAAATITMGLPKVGLAVFPGAELAGTIYVADIGYPPALTNDAKLTTHLVTAAMVRSQIPPRPADSHKGTYGRVLIIAGSVGFTGAVVLATRGALRTGAGLVTVGVPKSIYPIVASHVIEGMPTPLPDAQGALAASALKRIEALAARSDVVAIGPGLSQTVGVRSVVEGLLKGKRPLVIDADGLNVLAGRATVLARARAPVVITPHPGELSRLTGLAVSEIQADRIGAARNAAAKFRCVVVLKGARTVVATPEGEAFIVPTGNPGLATGGMGDVLTGAIASLIGQGVPPPAAAYAGAYLHGLAADLVASAQGMVGMLASEVADHLPKAIQQVLSGEQKDEIIELRD